MKYISEDNMAKIVGKIKADLARKQDTEIGKYLSSNDFTNDLRAKLESINSLAQENIIESVSVNNVSCAVANKAINISVPTKLSELINDNDLADKNYVSNLINQAIASVTQFNFEVVSELPENGDLGVIYLTEYDDGTSTGDAHREWIWTGEDYELLGTTDIDLSNYVQKTDLVALTDSEIDTMWNPNPIG